MIIWGGHDAGGRTNTGARYNPTANSWNAMSTTSAPSARLYHTAVWTGSAMIVWGGYNSLEGGSLNTGGVYYPDSNSWDYFATSLIGAPTARQQHMAFWTGSEMVIWGGDLNDYGNTGAVYNPNSRLWFSLSTFGAPEERQNTAAVWTGSELIVWGGIDYGNLNHPAGGRLLLGLYLYRKP
jgi:hypothetical protein